jgi:hypothetical protein
MAPEILLALWVAERVYEEMGADEFVVTSVTDGRHSQNSRHHCGHAADIRIWTLPSDPGQADTTSTSSSVIEAARRIDHRLGPRYYVEVESTHIHIQHNS